MPKKNRITLRSDQRKKLSKIIRTGHRKAREILYAHILLNAVPLMRHKGISDEQIHTLLVENPRRLLAFAPAKE